MNKKKSLDLTNGTIWKVLVAFLLPIMAGSLIQQLYTTVDAVIVGRFVGKAGLAAIDSVYTLFKFPINFMNGLAAGATIIISGYVGGGDEKELDCSVHTAYTIALLLGVVCSIAGVIFAPQLLNVMSVPEDIFDSTLTYCRIYFGGLWTLTLYNMIAGVLRAFGDSKTPFYILIVCAIINIVGDYVLIGIFGGGVAAAAIATVAAQAVSAFLAIVALSRKHMHCNDKIWALKFCTEHMPRMIKLGFPLAMQSILFPVANSIVQASINNMGTDSIAAWAVCGKLDLLIWLIADSMAPALSTYCAQNLGAQKKDRVFKGVMIGTGISVGLVGLVSLILFVFAAPLGGLFISSADATAIIPMVVKFMAMMCPFYVFYSVAEAGSGACCGLGDTVKPMITTLLCTCGLRVVAIFFILPMFQTMECIVWIYVASWITTGVAFASMFMLLARKVLK